MNEWVDKLQTLLPDKEVYIKDGKVVVTESGRGLVMIPKLDAEDDRVINIASFLERVFRRAQCQTI